ncbi:hypothetical protein ET445_11225 [Agromyces protaetiae]|uniref:Uncharacterized protein n=1 Tax=Agromyces protaetiae TaxID=2509455 RepID=A0A4V0YH85_9MICO|nr:hypothetical protein [Agromyces protaetiae]QAY73831.1 hypothetical protein ET445_11225 [Agromyces protaetiae]
MGADAGGGEYVAEYIDGPLEGEFERRALDERGEPEARVARIAAIDGLESTFWYAAVDRREVGGEPRVRFSFDADASDGVEYDIDDNE